jgi:flagellin
MALNINTNTTTTTAARHINTAVNNVNKSNLQAASGLKINKAADNASGLAISEQLRTQVRQSSQEINNLQTGTSVINTADSAIGTQQKAVGRLQELATQAANGTMSSDQRAAINQEAQQLVEQVNQTAQNTQFNGTQLLNGSTTSIPLGTQSGEQVTLNSTTTSALGISGVNLNTSEGAAAAMETLNNASEQLSQSRASLGAQSNQLESAVNTLETSNQNAQSADSAIRDADTARVTMERTRSQMMLQQSISALTQGNVAAQGAMQLLGA